MALSLELKEGTKESHSAAENTKFVAAFLRGVLNPEEYRKLIANFYFVYSAMEESISSTEDPMVKAIRSEDLERKESLAKDLKYYYGSNWEETIVPTEACNTYVHRIKEVAEQNPYLLIAHHYTRYIGDLSGGQILKEITARVLNPPIGEGLNFYDFPSIPNAKEFKNDYRAALDTLGCDEQQVNALITEANYAFRLNMYMFDEIQGKASQSFLKLLGSYAKQVLGELMVSKRFRNDA
jgi:heme oxygenase|tara:strand:- start:673 stop:1386 length:714 start_codon:yes stop_codon:yes gene_type:complete